MNSNDNAELLRNHKKHLENQLKQKEAEYKKAQEDVCRLEQLIEQYPDLTISRVRRSSLYCSASLNSRADLEVYDYNSCSCCPDYDYGVQLSLNGVYTYPPNIYIGTKYARDPDLEVIENQMSNMKLDESIKDQIREFVNNFQTFDNDDD